MNSLYDTWGFPCEFPHSEISGSLAMCAYPKLIAAYHVLHRLLMPRHSPCALCSLTFYSFISTNRCVSYKNYLLTYTKYCSLHNFFASLRLSLLNFVTFCSFIKSYYFVSCIIYSFAYVSTTHFINYLLPRTKPY